MPIDPRPARQTKPAEPPAPLLPTPEPPEEESVRMRAGALVDTSVIRTDSDAAVKHNTFPSRPGYPRAMTSIETHLHVEAWVKNTTYAKNVWVDVHVFESEAEPVHRATLPLAYARPAGDSGDVFVLDSPVFQGLVATPGSVTLRPDARVVQYRLYSELDGTVYTDGVLHRCELRADSASG